MNQSNPRRHDDIPATEELSPTPPEPSATLPISLTKTLSKLATPRPSTQAPAQRYSRLGLHARGGLGEVFLAQDEELPREVALKEIRADRDDDHSRLRFVIEGTITGSLEHPGIVPVYSLGAHADGRPFYAMRLIRGQTLQQAIADLQPADFASAAFRQLLQRLVTVCQTLQYAHDRGVIHRDLKPANIMVGSYGETLVVDWGLAKVIGQADAGLPAPGSAPVMSADGGSNSAETAQGVVLGTPSYMSPEQASGLISELTPATDIYALGATLYHLLTGQSPLKQPGQYSHPIERVREGDIAPPRSINSRIPKPLEAICQKAMALRPNDRYASARDLAADLERWLADEPLAAYREPLHLRAGRWLRKHPVAVATGATSLALILIAALVISAISSTYSQQLTTAYNKLNLQHGELAFKNKQLSESHGQLVQANFNLKAARDTAEANEKEAVELAAESKAVLDFLEQRILVAARPGGQDGGAGRNILLREALEAASTHIDASFAAQPLIRVRLHRTLGNSLLLLGGHLPARSHFEAADKLLAADGDATQPEDLANALDLATTFHEAGDLPKARDQIREVLSNCQEHLGVGNRLTLRAKHRLADVQAALGQTQEARQLREATLDERRRHLGPDHHDTLVSMASLAQSWQDTGKANEALQLSKETHQKMKDKLGPDHPDTLACLRTVGELYARRGQEGKSVEILEQQLSDLTQQLGPDHDATLEAMQALAKSYFGVKRPADATKLYNNAIARRKARFGASHGKTIRLERDWSARLVDAGRFQAATPILEDVLARARVAFGAHDQITIDCMRLLANCYMALDREQAALELHIEAYVRCRDSLGQKHNITLDRMFDLAIDFNRLQVYPVALELRQNAFDIQQELDDPSNPQLLLSMTALAQSHLMVRQSAEAAGLLRTAIERRELRAIAHPDDKENACYLAYALGQLGHAEELRGNWGQGHDWYRQSAEAFTKAREKFGPLGRFFDSVNEYYESRDRICQKTSSAVEDLSFVDRQPREEVSELLMATLHHLRRTKDIDGAAATAEALEATISKGLTTAYQAGVAWSLVSDLAEDAQARDKYADRAIGLLDRVKPKGDAQFKTAVQQAYAFHFNPDLASIRERAGFKSILERLPKMGKDLIWRDQPR